MLNSITGILNKKGDDFVFIQAGPMEWDITMSAYSISKLPKTGAETKIFTFLYHKEDSMKLFGFFDEKERVLFNEIIKVGGIGPKGAVKILSGISPEGFIRALDDEDLDTLCRLPGLGKKTAQKIVLTLRGKLAFREETENQKNKHSEIIDSLVNMGFDRKQAAAAVKNAEKELSEKGPEPAEEEIFRNALISLSS